MPSKLYLYVDTAMYMTFGQFPSRIYKGLEMILHWVVQHDILFSQLQQHRIIKEFVDTDILTQTLETHIRDT
mgnify:FL=1